MKMRFLFAFAALEIGLAVQALAPGLVNLSGDAKTLDEFIALSMKEAEAFNNNDAAAVAALFADDAIYAAPEGVFYGQNAIEKRFADLFQRWHPTNFIDQTHKMNAMGNEPWAVGEWWCTLESQNGPVQVSGYWSEIYVRVSDAWQIRMSTFFNKTPLPAPPAETK